MLETPPSETALLSHLSMILLNPLMLMIQIHLLLQATH